MATRVGIIGLGLLGSALAQRLLSAGFQTVGFDSDEIRLAEFAAAGGEDAASATDVAAAADRILFSLPDSDAVAVVLSEIEPTLRDGLVIIDTTTGAPHAVVETSRRLAERQVIYLDATVAGSSQQARDGKAVMMVGGDKESFAACSDIFTGLAERVFYVGASGSGSRMKLIVNLVLGLNRAVLAEGLALAKACGMDLDTCLEILKSGAAYSAAMDSKGRKMIEEDFTPQARLAQHLKDVGLIRELGTSAGTELPFTCTHEELLRRACELGYADADNSAVVKAFD